MENLAREAVIKSLGVVKLPGVENLPTVFFCGEMYVLPTTLRSAAGCSDPVTTRLLILGTNHTLFFGFYINWAVLHNKPTCSGWLRTHSGMGRGLVSRGKKFSRLYLSGRWSCSKSGFASRCSENRI